MPSIQDIMAKKKAFEAELSEFSKAALSEEFKKAFAAHPDLKAIQWRQYTPYFNDGDPCTFRVTEFEMSLTSTPDDDSKSDYGIDGFEPTWTTKGGRTPPERPSVSSPESMTRSTWPCLVTTST